jgi:hypothetical protein
VAQFLAIRAEYLQVKNGFAQPQPGELDKAARWLDAMLSEEVPDIEPAFRLAFGHVKAGDAGWTKREHSGVAFMFGAILSRWSDLREELHGQKPTMPEPKPPARPGQQPGRVVPIVES